MAKHSNLNSLFTGIADAIRSKTGGTEAIVADDFPEAIANIPSGDSTEEWIGDGNTHIWITLHEGRTSPMLGVCPNGTVTVDWGDGTEPDALTGTSVATVQWTSNHEYAEPGEYVITLTVDGEMGFDGISGANGGANILRYGSSSDGRNVAYTNAIRKVEIGSEVTSIGNYAFFNCYSLTSITIPESITSIGNNAFQSCYSLTSIIIPESATSIGNYAFQSCYSLASITIPEGVKRIGNSAFNSCYSLASITIPEGVTSIGNYAFQNCYSLTSITIPKGVKSIGNGAFQYCYSLASITIPDGVTSISGMAFYYCYGVRFFDFTKHTAVPTLSNTNAFSGITDDCEIRVPAALVDEWKAATNWATYASYIVGV